MRDLAWTYTARVEPTWPIVQEIADHLLNDQGGGVWQLNEVATALVKGITRENALQRLELIGHKLRSVDKDDHGRRWFAHDTSGTLSAHAQDEPHGRLDVLLGAFVSAADRTRSLLGPKPVLDVAGLLPTDLQGRLRAWLLGTDPGTSPEDLVAEVTSAVPERDPTGDDLLVVQRAVELSAPERYSSAWAEALGRPPTIEQLGRALAEHDLDPAWVRAYRWIGLLPSDAAANWSDAYALMCSAYGTPSAETLQKRRRVDIGTGRSPLTEEELAARDPLEAAPAVGQRRPDPGEFLVGPRELSQVLQAVVAKNPEAWLARPLQTALALHEPIYITHYLLGAADAIKAGAPVPVADLMKVVDLVRTQPWGPTPMGRAGWEIDIGWRPANAAAIDLLRALADSSVGYAGADDHAWEILTSVATDRSQPSTLLGEHDLLTVAVNRSCTRGLDAAFSFMRYEVRAHGAPREGALNLVATALRTPEVDGALYRAVVASHLAFLIAAAPEWAAENEELLFGSDAPDDLGDTTLELVLKWSRPLRWVLERRRGQVFVAARKGTDSALNWLLVGYLWGIDHYGADEMSRFLSTTSGLTSAAGESLGRLLREADRSAASTGADLWRTLLKGQHPGGLSGFGWFAEVTGLDDTEWGELTLRTMRENSSPLAWSHGISGRIETMSPSTTTLAILDGLVRHPERPWDGYRAAEVAADHLKNADELRTTPEYQRLRVTLDERGAP